MDKTEVNMNVLNKVIAFKLLRILRDNGFIEDGKYANIERKSIQYGESINPAFRRVSFDEMFYFKHSVNSLICFILSVV